MRFGHTYLTLLLVTLVDVFPQHHSVDAKHRRKIVFGSNGMSNDVDPQNPRPIIGILSELPPSDITKQYSYAQSVIHQAYVAFIEMGGARTAPILIDRDDKYYQDKFSDLNGLILQGEDASLKNESFQKAANTLLKLATQANDDKDYFPVLAINAGFGVLANYMAGSTVQTACDAKNLPLPLEMTKNYTTSRLFSQIPSDVNLSLTTLPVTYNFHMNCLIPKDVAGTSLSSSIHVLSTNKDSKGVEFVSTFEAIKYPFYALQWNPERNPFEWSLSENKIPHTYEAVRAVQYVANVFAAEARKSLHKFSTPQEEDQSIIYHYKLYFLTNTDTAIKVMFIFQNNTK